MRTLLHGGAVLDTRSGSVSAADITVEDGRIADVAAGLDGDEGIDCSGLTLLPGLIDCHAHMAFAGLEDTSSPPTYRLLEAVPKLRRTLQLGITTVRDAWGADAGPRDAVQAGHVAGPRLLVSLAQLCGTGGIGDHFAPTPARTTECWAVRTCLGGSLMGPCRRATPCAAWCARALTSSRWRPPDR